MSSDRQETVDVLGEPYTARDPGAARRRRGRGRRDAGEPAGRGADNRAVLHVHGFADYFFQTAGRRLLGGARATTSTPSTCASTAGRCARTRPRTSSPTWPTTTRSSTRPAGGSPSGTATTTWWSPRTPPAAWSRRCGCTTGRPAVAGAGAELPVARPAGQPAAAHGRHQGDRPGRRPPALPGDPPRRVRLLRPQPAPRPRGRVGLRPGLEAAGVLAGVRRLAARRTPRARAGAPGARRRRRRCWC